MDKSLLLSKLLDCLPDQIAVITASGCIAYVNFAWVKFGIDNGQQYGFNWIDVNYLSVCKTSIDLSDGSDDDAQKVFDGISAVLNGSTDIFYYEYPCHSLTINRWFLMRVVPIHGMTEPFFVVSHVDITQRKLIEEKFESQSITDPVTLIANRRHFDKFLAQEWYRNMRSQTPLSLVMFDIDLFKNYNDEYGHVAGDEYLREVAKTLNQHTRRTTDLAARFGGEEFALILGNTDLDAAKIVADSVRTSVVSLGQKLIGDACKTTISAGVASTIPQMGNAEEGLVKLADRALYKAKEMGRNCVVGQSY